MTVEIREMGIADYDQVIDLWQATEGIGLSSADSREAIARYLARNPGLSFLAYQTQGRLVGAVLCGHDGRRGYVHHLAVCPEFRGQGVGRALIDRCLESLKREGIEKCHLFVYRTNDTGRAFWEKVGWEERKTLAIMSKDV